MRFKVDENLPLETAALLRAAKHEADTVLDEQLSGARDERIAAICKSEGRALLTLDQDFADIRTYPPGEYGGIIVLRIDRQDKVSVLKVVEDVISKLAKESPAGAIWVVDERQIRIRTG